MVTLKFNNVITNDPCAWCGQRTDPTGMDFFAEDSESLVCDDCVRDVAPELYRFRYSGCFQEFERANLDTGSNRGKYSLIICGPGGKGKTVNIELAESAFEDQAGGDRLADDRIFCRAELLGRGR